MARPERFYAEPPDTPLDELISQDNYVFLYVTV